MTLFDACAIVVAVVSLGVAAVCLVENRMFRKELHAAGLYANTTELWWTCAAWVILGAIIIGCLLGTVGTL